MPVTIYLSGHLKAFSNGELQISIEGNFATVADVLDSLCKRHPALRDRVLNEQGELRTHVNIFMGNEDVKRKDGLNTKIDPADIHIFNAVSGG